jgi:hypothetical protein
MNRFSSVANSSASRKSQHFYAPESKAPGEAATYCVRLQEIKYITTDKGPAVVVSAEVISSDHPHVREKEIRDWYCSLNPRTGGPADMRAFLECVYQAATGDKFPIVADAPEDVKKKGTDACKRWLEQQVEDSMEAACGVEQLFRGFVVTLRCYNIKTKSVDPTTGLPKDFTQHVWSI